MKKKFDTIAFKDKVQKEIYEETKDLSPEELVKYFNKAGEQFQLDMEKLRSGKKTSRQSISKKKAESTSK